MKMKISKMPAPPPPPPLAPAAPPPPVFKAPKGGANDRDALLKSIKKGAKLKKTVTNDRSAPLLSSTPSNNKTVNHNDNSSNSSTSSAKNFSSIHMELKRQLGGDMDNSSNNVASPMRNFNSIQMELKKQLANDNRNRGPPPPAPNRNLPETNLPKKNVTSRENGPNGFHLSQLSLNANSNLQVNPSALHRKAKSNANLSTLESNNDNSNGFQAPKPVINHGKPNLAPKPPALNGKPVLNPRSSSNSNNKPSLGRAQSMKSAQRSPSPQSPVDAVNTAIKFGTVRHMSSVLSQALATNPGQPQMQHARSRLALNGRPTAPPPSVPQQPPPPIPSYPSSPSQPAPPPPSKIAVKHPNHAPPPPPPLTAPPVEPPPPPPHKTLTNRQPAPSIPSLNAAANPPPPPPRLSSMRENPTSATVDLEEKFKHLFKTVDKFPHPPPYRNVVKLYNYRPTQKPNYIV